jgi:hypothetical protein
MAAFRIIILCVVATVTYGILHDHITARICVEYFTIGHPDIFGTDNATLLGFGWGILATWWVGLILGIALATAARLGAHPKMGAKDLARPIGILLLVSAYCALAAGAVGYMAASNDWVALTGPIASQVPADRHVPFLVDLWAHSASYASALLGGAALVIWTWRARHTAVNARNGPDGG